MQSPAPYPPNFFAALQYSTVPGSHDSDIGPIIFLVFCGLCIVGIFIFTVLAIVIAAKRRGDRAAKLRMTAQQLGFSFTPKPAVPNFLHNTRFAQWYPAVGTGIHNLLQGVAGERPILVFDFGYTRTMGGYGSATYRETVMCVPRGAAPPFIFFRERTLVPPESIQTFIGQGLRGLLESEQRGALAQAPV
jgi:hypothetical protein